MFAKKEAKMLQAAGSARKITKLALCQTSESICYLMNSAALSNTSISEFKQPIKLYANLCFVGLENSKYTLADC